MLMVPIFEPGPVAIGAAVGVAAAADGAFGGLVPAAAGAAAPAVWAHAEIIEITATARRERTNLLFIGSFRLLGAFLGSERNSDYALPATLGAHSRKPESPWDCSRTAAVRS